MNWFFYFLRKSVSQRKGRFIISSIAVALTVTVITALLTLSAGIRAKIGYELKQYGANMLITDGAGNEIAHSVADTVRSMSQHVRDATSQIYGTVLRKERSYEIIGMEAGKMNGFRLDGNLPQKPDEIMVGINLKALLDVHKGATITFDDDSNYFKVTAIFEKGPDENSAIIMPLEGAGQFLNKQGVSAVLLNVDTHYMKEIESSIKGTYPFLSVKTLRQVAVAEEKILSKIQMLMLIVTLVVLFSSVIALGSTMGANVIERMEEIGLMKAIGATEKSVRNFFMYEAAFSGLVGAGAGYVLGIAIAEAVSKTAFGSFISVNVFVVFISLIVGVFIAVSSTYLPVRDAMKIVPAQILRGE